MQTPVAWFLLVAAGGGAVLTAILSRIAIFVWSARLSRLMRQHHPAAVDAAMSRYDDDAIRLRSYRRGNAPGSMSRLMEELDKAVPAEMQDPEVRITVIKIRAATTVMIACVLLILAIAVIAHFMA